ncbi:hypothetical protein CAPTEDRAFT_221873 [Capitella teleta]|uniref:Death domain-containing protein n=1 Tax=Capitella teleta TaxID=283909 RepID=R7UT39_CAPTE|nr:hypothetical protein CAPTEDRAFT_221873 [Capitella teleta]|eukprot:ELU09375.1 hypothetical protein CAPTEDRAFT_221873 [Capitella teleta]
MEGDEKLPCSEQGSNSSEQDSNSDNTADARVEERGQELLEEEEIVGGLLRGELINKRGDSIQRGGYKEPEMEAMTLLMKIEKLMTMIEAEKGIIEETHFKDYDRLDHLRSVSDQTQVVCQQCEEKMEILGKGLQGLKSSLTQIKDQMDKRITNDGLMSWLDTPKPHPSDYTGIAKEKRALQRASESRLSIGKGNVDIARLEAKVEKLEEEVTMTTEDAEEAERVAMEAVRLAEEAKKAAEEKRLADEKAAKILEEARKKKEEETRRKRMEEERKQAEEERLAGSPEELERRRREAERRNPNNWPSFVYSVEAGPIGIPIGCVVRVMEEGCSRGDINVEQLDQLTGIVQLDGVEELVGNIIQLTQTDPKMTFNLEEPLAIAIPHCAPRNVASREPVVKSLQEDGTWTELPTREVTIDDMKEYKFVEVRLPNPNATLTVVTRTRRETFTIQKRGGKVNSSVDSRVCFSFKQSTFRTSSDITLEVQTIDSATVHDLKVRHADVCDNLLTTSPILCCEISNQKTYKPFTMSLPVPPNPHKPRRPVTAMDRPDQKRAASGKPRPASAMPSAYQKEETAEDELHILTQAEDSDEWVRASDIQLTQSKNRDSVMWDTRRPPHRVIVLRTKPETTGPQAEKIVRQIEVTLTQRVTQLVLRQHSQDAGNVLIQCSDVHRMERTTRKLTEQGFEHGPALSQEIIMGEGQVISVQFRGNLQMSQQEEPVTKFVYNSHIKACLNFDVMEIDKYAQKGIDCYRGFAQVFTRGLVPKVLDVDEDKTIRNKKGGPRVEMVEEDIMLCEMLISLPKPEPESPKPIVNRVPVKFNSHGLVGNDILRHLASEVGEEWRRLAQCLNIRRARIQAIVRNNVNSDSEQVIYDMLLTWAKKVPRSMNKVDILCHALMQCGRSDLVEELKDRDLDYRQEKAMVLRETVLNKAFIRVAQNSYVINDWRCFARRFGLGPDDVADIEGQSTGVRDRCFKVLVVWSGKNPDCNIEGFIKLLRKSKYHHAANQLENGI